MKRWLLIVLLFYLSTVTNASLFVEPTRFELVLNPNDRTTGAIKVSNTTDQPLLVKVKAYDWDLDPEGNLQEIAFGNHNTTLSEYLKFNPKQFLIEPNQTQIVRFTVTMPSSPPTERRTMVFFETDEVATAGNIRTILTTQVGTVIYATSSKAHASFRLLDMKTTLDDENGLVIHLLCTNPGEAHVRLDLSFSIYDLNGQEHFSNKISGDVLLPQKNLILHIPIETELLTGLYRFVGRFTFENTEASLPFTFPFSVDRNQLSQGGN